MSISQSPGVTGGSGSTTTIVDYVNPNPANSLKSQWETGVTAILKSFGKSDAEIQAFIKTEWPQFSRSVQNQNHNDDPFHCSCGHHGYVPSFANPTGNSWEGVPNSPVSVTEEDIWDVLLASGESKEDIQKFIDQIKYQQQQQANQGQPIEGLANTLSLTSLNTTSSAIAGAGDVFY